MRCATFNVLADAYTGYGDYSHVEPALLLPNARTQGLVQMIDGLEVDVIGLQEAEESLLRALEDTDKWQTFWSPKGRDKPDGCLTLVRPGLEVSGFETYHYSDGSGHIAQTLNIGRVLFANTHTKWAPADSPEHIGVAQTKELLEQVGREQPAVIFADCNDRPHGPVRQLIEGAGFTNVCEDEPTAIVNQELVALDLLAVRGVTAKCMTKKYDLASIPSRECPSDHIPVVAELEFN
jgi:endonuclease/exonuclease/phosphatase family metal-dependent hydrolase